MIAFCGYNFGKDGNSLDPVPTNVKDITSTYIQNGIYDCVFATRNVTDPYSTTIPSVWDIYTIMLANFNGNLSAGNIDIMLQAITSVRIKKRKQSSFEWITIKEIPINTMQDLNFVFEDYFSANNEEYEYAWVPVLNNVEGNFISQKIFSQFNGVFIADADTIYKFYAGVSYGVSEQVQKIGTFEPFGKQYPVYVSNSLINYQTGSLSGKIIGQYEKTYEFDRKEMVEEKNQLLKFLTNKKAKLIKDWNGNEFLCVIVGNPNVAYDSNWGMGMMTVSASYSECGQHDNANDMQKAGLIPVIGG